MFFFKHNDVIIMLLLCHHRYYCGASEITKNENENLPHVYSKAMDTCVQQQSHVGFELTIENQSRTEKRYLCI